MAYPTDDRMEAAMRVLYYLPLHKDLGLHYTGDCGAPVEGYTDPDGCQRLPEALFYI